MRALMHTHELLTLGLHRQLEHKMEQTEALRAVIRRLQEAAPVPEVTGMLLSLFARENGTQYCRR